jgi:tetratricopeptide (TPR) repeat protein
LRIWLSNFYSAVPDYDRAGQELEAALKVNPDSMAVQFQIGRLAALSGKDLDRGEAMLKAYLKYTPKEDEPSIAAAHYRLGGVYEKQGKKDLARQHYAIALKSFPKSKEIGEAHKRVS